MTTTPEPISRDEAIMCGFDMGDPRGDVAVMVEARRMPDGTWLHEILEYKISDDQEKKR